MSATVQIHEMTALAAGVDKTSGTVRFKTTDDQTVDTNARMQVPAAGTNYSYTKQLRFYFSTGPSVDINNLAAYTDGSNTFGTGVGVQYSLPGNTWGANVNTNISGTDLFTKTSGAKINLSAVNAGPYSGTGYKGDLLRLQMTVASTASPGTLTAETLTFSYDET